MFFKKFPAMLYTVDNYQTGQLIKDIFRRVVLSEQTKQKFSAFDEYDIRDGDTPEVIAYKVYGDSNYHWVVLLTNELFDGRFDWPLSGVNFDSMVDNNYSDRFDIHHYENTSGVEINGILTLASSAAFGSFAAGDAFVTNLGAAGYINSKASSSSIHVTTTKGGINAGNQIIKLSNSSITANVTTVTVSANCTSVSNYEYETELNEAKRRIKILKPQFVNQIELELEKTIKA